MMRTTTTTRTTNDDYMWHGWDGRRSRTRLKQNKSKEWKKNKLNNNKEVCETKQTAKELERKIPLKLWTGHRKVKHSHTWCVTMMMVRKRIMFRPTIFISVLSMDPHPFVHLTIYVSIAWINGFLLLPFHIVKVFWDFQKNYVNNVIYIIMVFKEPLQLLRVRISSSSTF